ncbi:hypothetical protein GJ629_12145 [Halapricum sp. CBA1109]|uniref:hypothetical protein n=1 Tax=Halapricum sp. CBA1109 TaxID=2668068 RepID=UPI0012FCE7BD|nr:hypothetical protein [Halapricum sp. CBA1109]MUV90559.1 hypothetical protein [Halapricum sp. CBA1109]
MTDLSDVVARSLAPETRERFTDRVDEQAAFLRAAFDDGDLDNDEFAIGLEMEVYAVADSEDPRLVRLPAERFSESDAITKELGLHNAEINTDPSVFDDEGLAEQAATIRRQTDRARAAVADDGELVLDAMWTTPPAEGAHSYLAATDDRDGLAVAANMRPAPRYVAIDEAIREQAGGTLSLSVPGADVEFPSILFESLATSIQPHLQIPDTDTLPAYYDAGIRTLGPLLALATNSPFLPGEFYEGADPERVLDETHHELRIAVFEQSVNYTDSPKVRVPEDIDAPEDIVDGVLADDLVAPFLREWVADGPKTEYTDNYWEFEHKRGTYWRWLRCVIGGDPVGTGDERSARIEYRPLPTQPTVTDVVGLQALTAGLLVGLVAADHPITDLPWEAAEESFYAAAAEGLDAELAWVTADGERTTDRETIFEEVFEYATRGLTEQGVADPESYLAPIRARWEAGTTPSQWKIARVREGLDDGLDLAAAIERMQRTYVRHSAESDSFAEWP